MDAEQRRVLADWLEKWRDPEFVRSKAAMAGINLADVEGAVALFDGPLKVGSMLAIEELHSGLYDMQVQFARIAHEKKLREMNS